MIKKNLQGQVLIANPNNPHDEISRSLILLVLHTPERAVGLQINNPLEGINLSIVAENIGIKIDTDDALWFGGSVGNNKIHVVHSSDWAGMSTIEINKEISITNDISVLSAIAGKEGPSQFRACAGFYVWEDGQLDRQLFARNDDQISHRWETVRATGKLIFQGEGPDQWVTALETSTKQQVAAWF